MKNRYFVLNFRVHFAEIRDKLMVFDQACSRMSSPWWQGATLYQIYPRSFQDSNGDGIGDLAGITDRLPYVASLGVDGIWLSPFFLSPMRDFGYDVTDHRQVDPIFGTLEDFDALIRRAHGLGLKVVIDQVWSHTAAENAWFQESRQSRDNPKADWYVWADARPDGSPPNNWLSWMGGPAWRWEPRRRQYHLHHFLPQMPDLNFHCPAVQEAVLDIARFWLDRGVDGFRLDTANLYAHDPLLRDNPPAPADQRGDTPVMMQQHRYTMNQPESLAFLRRVRALMDTYPDRMTVGEIGGADALGTMLDYTRGARALHTAYSFAFLGDRPDAAAVARQLEPWGPSMARGLGAGAHHDARGGRPDGDPTADGGPAHAGWPSWAFSNHDAPRVASRWGGEGVTAFSFGAEAGAAVPSPDAQAQRNDSGRRDPLTWMALLVALRGTLFIYQGEELGLPQSTLAFEDLQDPFGLANWPLNPGRDGCRTPMPWQQAAPHAGFSTTRPWLPVDPAHAALAVDGQEAQADSMLQHTRTLLRLRREHRALRTGRCDVLHAAGDVLVLRRGDVGGESGGAVLAIFNLGSSQAPWPADLPPGGLDPARCLWCHPHAWAADTALPAGAAAFFLVQQRTSQEPNP